MKKVLDIIFIFLSSIRGAIYAGKILGMLDYCRNIVCNNNKTFACIVHKRLSIENILPTSCRSEIRFVTCDPTDKIKVRIIYPAGCSWNNIHTLYEAFAKDDKFQTYIIVNNYPRFIDIMHNVGCKFVTLEDYDITTDKPDILVASYYSDSDNIINFPGVHQYVGKIYAAIPNVVMNEKNNDIHWSYIHRAYKNMNPDYYLCELPVFNSLLDYIPSEKLIKLGNPQYDEIFYEVGKDHPIPQKWVKLKGKTIFLWATDHGVNESYATNGFTIDLYLADMLKYFSSHDDIGLIFRPHPQFIREILQSRKFWTESDINKMKDYFDNTPNVIWDDTHDYCCAFDLCNAFLVDLNCSITCAALTTGKPICRLQRTDIQEWLISKDLTDCYYFAKGMDEIISFINDVKEGNDPKKNVRKKGLTRAICNFDGKNGQRMKDFIAQSFSVK